MPCFGINRPARPGEIAPAPCFTERERMPLTHIFCNSWRIVKVLKFQQQHIYCISPCVVMVLWQLLYLKINHHHFSWKTTTAGHRQTGRYKKAQPNQLKHDAFYNYTHIFYLYYKCSCIFKLTKNILKEKSNINCQNWKLLFFTFCLPGHEFNFSKRQIMLRAATYSHLKPILGLDV